jgi:D-xylose transport system ATP-binding protein
VGTAWTTHPPPWSGGRYQKRRTGLDMNQAQAAGPLLRIDGITKHFGPVVALDGVSFEVNAGEVVGLLGDNGAGKSTLIKIVSGSLEPSAGRIWFDGVPVTFESPADAKALGIETVYQDLSLCPNVDTVANFFMGRELCRNVLGVHFLRESAMQAETERALADIGTHIPSVRTTVEHLSGGQRQAIELCRFVHWGGRLVLLDEPFAALGVQQTRRGLELIEQIRRRGVAIVVITHNVLHAFQVADRIVVLRHGRVAGERAVAATSHEEIVGLVTGELGDEAAADPPRERT